MSYQIPRDRECWYCRNDQHAKCPLPAICNCYTCYPLAIRDQGATS